MAKNDKKVRIFSALEVANICVVVNQTAINWIKNGYLKAFTTPGGQYRVYSEDLVDFLHSLVLRMPDELQRVLEEQLDIDTVLIVDDDKDLNNLVHQYLSKKHPDYDVYQAFDGFEAGPMLAEKKPTPPGDSSTSGSAISPGSINRVRIMKRPIAPEMIAWRSITAPIQSWDARRKTKRASI